MCYKVQMTEAKRDWWMVFVQTAGSIFNILSSALLGQLFDFTCLVSKVYFIVTTTYNACTNMTTNEQLNWRRYDYFKNHMGLFHNPFNRGIKLNLKEFFHLQRSVEDITNPESMMSV